VKGDLVEQVIRYTYEPEDAQTAVPEEGILSVRDSGHSAELYSADQLVSPEQARKLILEPLFFAGTPSDETLST
jgi:hypothetical protein